MILSAFFSHLLGSLGGLIAPYEFVECVPHLRECMRSSMWGPLNDCIPTMGIFHAHYLMGYLHLHAWEHIFMWEPLHGWLHVQVGATNYVAEVESA